MLPRLQLFEFNDLGTIPPSARDTIVEALSRALVWGRMLRGLVAPFQAFLVESGADEVLDLGAGAGGPARVLVRELQRAGGRVPRMLLTDLHPRAEAWQAARDESDGAIDYVPASVDATAVPAPLAAGRARCLINVLHHFPPEAARAVFADAVREGRGIFVAEAFAREPWQFLNFAPAGLCALMAGPLLGPRDRLAKALLTWATPTALAMSVWDGLVSTLRVYTAAELLEMAQPLGPGWRWRAGTYAYPPFGRGHFFYGVPPSIHGPG